MARGGDVTKKSKPLRGYRSWELAIRRPTAYCRLPAVCYDAARFD